MTTDAPAPQGKEFDPLVAQVVRDALAADRVASGKIREAGKQLQEWKAYREKQRDIVRQALGGHGAGRFHGELLVTNEPKDQYNGTEFAKQYPELALEFTKTKEQEYMDWEAAAEKYPEIVAKFQVSTFVNKTSF